MTNEEYEKRNEMERTLVLSDYREVLSTEAGRRVLGGIFYACRMNVSGVGKDAVEMAYWSGLRDAALTVANTIRAIDAREVGACEAAYEKFLRTVREEE
jgi:hypothetical protein